MSPAPEVEAAAAPHAAPAGMSEVDSHSDARSLMETCRSCNQVQLTSLLFALACSLADPASQSLEAPQSLYGELVRRKTGFQLHTKQVTRTT